METWQLRLTPASEAQDSPMLPPFRLANYRSEVVDSSPLASRCVAVCWATWCIPSCHACRHENGDWPTGQGILHAARSNAHHCTNCRLHAWYHANHLLQQLLDARSLGWDMFVEYTEARAEIKNSARNKQSSTTFTQNHLSSTWSHAFLG